MFSKNFIISSCYFIVAFLSDSLVTSYGITNKFGKEGDPVVLWLRSLFGFDSLLLKIVYILLVLLIVYFIYKKISTFFGYWLLYSFIVGHIFGILTWIFLFNHEFNSHLIMQLHMFLVTDYGLFILAVLFGLFISFLNHKK